MKFACPHCAKKYNLADEKLSARDNVRLKCRQCGEAITVKEAGALVLPVLVEEVAAGAMSEAPPPLPTPPPPASFPPPRSLADTLERAGAEPNENGASLPSADAGRPPPRVSAPLASETGAHGLTPPLPPLSPSGAPPPPAPSAAAMALETSLSASAAPSGSSTGAASPLVPVTVADSAKAGTGAAAERDGTPSTSMRPSLSALSGQAAVWAEKFHGLDEQQRLWSALGVGVVIGLMLGALLF